MIKVYGINTCGSFKKAVKFFDGKAIAIETIDLKQTVPTISELKEYHEKSGIDIKRFFNTSGKLYRELDIKNKYKEMNIEEIYELLSKNGMLLKRPLIVDGIYVRVGFNLEEYDKKWN